MLDCFLTTKFKPVKSSTTLSERVTCIFNYESKWQTLPSSISVSTDPLSYQADSSNVITSTAENHTPTNATPLQKTCEEPTERDNGLTSISGTRPAQIYFRF